MKRLFVFVLCILFSFNAVADETSGDEEESKQDYNTIQRYDLSGLVLELSCFNYFNIGLGYNFGEYKVMSHHFFAMDYGVLMEYKTAKELHLRIFFDAYGGSAGILLGASGVVATNFEQSTVGIAPHIGIGFPGNKLFYRYNFYLNKKFNCHEIGLLILKDSYSDKRRK